MIFDLSMKWYDNDDAKGVNFFSVEVSFLPHRFMAPSSVILPRPLLVDIDAKCMFWFSCPLFCFKFYIFSFFCVCVVRGCDMC